MEWINLFLLLVIIKGQLFYEKYRISISFKDKSIWIVKWNYTDCKYYRHYRIKLWGKWK